MRKEEGEREEWKEKRKKGRRRNGKIRRQRRNEEEAYVIKEEGLYFLHVIIRNMFTSINIKLHPTPDTAENNFTIS